MPSDNLFELFEQRMPADRSSPFIHDDAGRTWTYADLESESARYANHFVDLGAQPGDRVVMQVEKSPAALFAYVGCLRAGLVFLPLNTAYQESELDYFIGDAEPAVVVCRPASLPLIEKLVSARGTGVVTTLDADGTGKAFDDSRSASETFETVPRAASDLAAILYTSGTTGQPKGAMLTHDNLASNAEVLHAYWGFVPDDVLLHALPIFHTHGLFVATHCVLMNGTSMHFLPKFDIDRVLALLPSCTVMMGVPTFYTRLLADDRFNADLTRDMRLFISGSAPMLTQTHHEFQARTGTTVLERYGMSETGMCTSNPLDGERVPGSVGFPLPGYEARVLCDDGSVGGAGDVGEIQHRGAHVFAGYWRKPEKTAEDFTDDGWFKSGDLGSYDERGYLSIVGRSKDLVITGGFNVYPKEIEMFVDKLPGVGESAIIGVPDPDFGEAVTAVIVPESEGATNEAAVIAAVKAGMANFKVPKRVHFVDELPRNAMGKVQKNLLRERFG